MIANRRTPPKVPRPAPAPLSTSTVIADLAETLSQAESPERAGILATFWAAHPRTPLIEPSRTPGRSRVTFLWRDAGATAVLLFVNRITDERALEESVMHQIPGTDVWHLTYEMRNDWRASYGFIPHRGAASPPWTGQDQVALRQLLDSGLHDPRNPLECVGARGLSLSVVELADAPAQPWLAERLLERTDAVPRGTVEQHVLDSGRSVAIYLPHIDHRTQGPGRDAAPLPAVVLLDGDLWHRHHEIQVSFDYLIARGQLPPCVVLMPSAGSREDRWAELGGEHDGSAWVVNDLLPWARARCNISSRRDDVIVAGQSLGGLTALRAAIQHPQTIGAALSQSASLWVDDLAQHLQSADLTRTRVYLEVGSQEWVLRDPNATLARRLQGVGADVTFVEYNGGHDYACWRGGLIDGLQQLLKSR